MHIFSLICTIFSFVLIITLLVALYIPYIFCLLYTQIVNVSICRPLYPPPPCVHCRRVPLGNPLSLRALQTVSKPRGYGGGGGSVRCQTKGKGLITRKTYIVLLSSHLISPPPPPPLLCVSPPPPSPAAMSSVSSGEGSVRVG